MHVPAELQQRSTSGPGADALCSHRTPGRKEGGGAKWVTLSDSVADLGEKGLLLSEGVGQRG